MRQTSLTAAVCLLAGSAFGQVTLFQGPPGLAGDVLVLGAVNPRPPELQGIVLLPIECVGRSTLLEFSEGRARRMTDVPGAARLLLPREMGSLYRYRRADDAGAAYGYMWVDARGRAKSVYERRGTGASGSDDPLSRRVSVTRDGSAFLCATGTAAEGDLIEVNLATGSIVNRTEAIEPQDFQRNGVLLLDNFGVGLSRNGILRFERGAFDQAEVLVPPGSNDTWYGPDLVFSADRTTVAFLFGEEEKKARVCVLNASGPFRIVSTRSMEVRGAGYLPEVPGGPTMALSSDGSFVAWRNEESSREAFVCETGTRSGDVHVTGDATLENTLNDTGVLAFVGPSALFFAAGRGGSEGVERADLFRIDLSRGSTGFGVTNLTQTSGQTRPPFDYGTLRASDGMRLVPGAGGAMLVHQRRDDRRGYLRWVSPAGEVRSVIEDVEALESVECAGAYLVATVRRPAGIDDPFEDSLRLVQIPRDGTAPSDLLLPIGGRLTRQAGSRSQDRFAGVIELGTYESIGRLRLPSLIPISSLSTGLVFGPTTGQLEDGSFVGTTIVNGLPMVFRWGDDELTALSTGVDGFLLPGI
jgi:hypothetical protein